MKTIHVLHRYRPGRAFLLLVAFCSAIGLSAAMGIAGTTVHIAAPNWAPYTGRQLSQHGFAAEIAGEAFRRVGYTATFHIMPWLRALKEVEAGEYDAAGFGYFSDERARTYLLSDPLAESILGFFSLKKAAISFQTLADLKGYRIGVVRGYINAGKFDSAAYLRKDVAQDDMTNFKKLLSGRLDLVVCDKYVGMHIVRTSFAQFQNDIVFLTPYLQVQPVHLMLSRKMHNVEKVKNDFNRGLQIIKENNTVDRILDRYGLK